MNEETRTRFLASIAKQLPPERVAEVHLFPAIKQGGVESGVAVIAVERIDVSPDVQETQDLQGTLDDLASVSEDEKRDPRHTIYSARYRHTLKGADRGKWEVAITEEADAPLITVDAVVRGVQRRSGDVDDSVRMAGDEFRAALPRDAA